MRIVPAGCWPCCLARERRMVGAGLPCSQVQAGRALSRRRRDRRRTRGWSPSGSKPRSRRPFVVENRGGATGNIGTVAVVDRAAGRLHAAGQRHRHRDLHRRASPSSPTIRSRTSRRSAASASRRRCSSPPPSIPANDIKGLVEWSKTKPDGLNYSTAGYGLQQHLAVEEIAQRTGGKFTHVAYRGGGTAMTDLIAARVDFGGFLAGTTKPLIADGKLKALAIVADKRSALVPDIPTTAEQGLPGMNRTACIS